MKRFLVYLAVLFPLFSFAQEWKIDGTDLKAKKTNGKLTISFNDNRHSIELSADTAYRDPALKGYVIPKSKNKYGLIDPFDLVLVKPCIYTSISLINDIAFVLRENGKSSFYGLELGDDLNKLKFDSIYELKYQNKTSNSFLYLMTIKGKKKGLLQLTSSSIFELIPCKYDDITVLKAEEDGFVYRLIKGKKQGAGDCEANELKVVYDEVVDVRGVCANNRFIVKKNGKYGFFTTGDAQLLSITYDFMQFIGENYLLFSKEGKYGLWDIDKNDFETPDDLVYKKYFIETKEGSPVKIIMESAQDKFEFIIQ